jgi:hypothetical protein
VNTRTGSTVLINVSGVETNVAIRFSMQTPSESRTVTWNLNSSDGAAKGIVPLRALDVSDDPWDSARSTTKNDLATIGNVDTLLSAAEQLTGEGGSHYQDEWSFYIFWINYIGYADRRHQANEITEGESNVMINARATRTVLESGPTLLSRASTKLPDVISLTTYTNNTDSDALYDVGLHDIEGTQSTLTVTCQLHSWEEKGATYTTTGVTVVCMNEE